METGVVHIELKIMCMQNMSQCFYIYVATICNKAQFLILLMFIKP